MAVFFKGEFFINLFNNGNQEILRIGEKGIKIYLSMAALNAFYIIGANYFQSIGEAVKSVILNLVRQVVLFIHLLIILPRYYGVDGVWLISPISDLVIVIFTAYFLKGNTVQLKERCLQFK